MKKLMIGNQAVAAGLHDGGLGVVSSYPVPPLPKLPNFYLNTMIFTVNGRPTKRLPVRLHSAQVLPARVRLVL